MRARRATIQGTATGSETASSRPTFHQPSLALAVRESTLNLPSEAAMPNEDVALRELRLRFVPAENGSYTVHLEDVPGHAVGVATTLTPFLADADFERPPLVPGRLHGPARRRRGHPGAGGRAADQGMGPAAARRCLCRRGECRDSPSAAGYPGTAAADHRHRSERLAPAALGTHEPTPPGSSPRASPFAGNWRRRKRSSRAR